MTSRLHLVALSCTILLAGCRSEAAPTSDAPAVAAASDLEAGRYLVEVGGCNDCHAVGYVESNGALPDSLWLMGSPVGFRGPWGTSYAKNLRLTTHQLTEDQWVARLQAGGLPPMPWPAVRALSDADARAVYRFVRSLGPAGELAPRPVGPDAEPATPYFDFVPQHLDRLAAPADSAAG
ncbi:cytochrome C [Rubrivirga marina]|uniref:Cytochrome c domain-containing protein n=1 Tax=Rubrivirga marina TaxID=1196024 RepID=A0A271J193_9BACT|nr:cytochrome C [Rubrivirga marina]PAP77262.1 hypothetical protein BSZ37_12870 [Rubrivirga marina]